MLALTSVASVSLWLAKGLRRVRFSGAVSISAMLRLMAFALEASPSV
jgi:hypothetical protein